MKKIEISTKKHPNTFVLVDDNDFEWLNQWHWFCEYNHYAVRDVGRAKQQKRIWMHRLINRTSEGLCTDHINGNTLDNRKENLRTATHQQNMRNRKQRKINISGHKGIVPSKESKNWCAQIKINRKSVYLGTYSDIKDAIQAREKAEELYFGEFSFKGDK